MALGITPRRREAWCRPVTDNPKYTFRCWLLRLGFIGEEFETARTPLLANLPGNAAWPRAPNRTKEGST